MCSNAMKDIQSPHRFIGIYKANMGSDGLKGIQDSHGFNGIHKVSIG